jgi:hypothetical protein
VPGGGVCEPLEPEVPVVVVLPVLVVVVDVESVDVEVEGLPVEITSLTLWRASTTRPWRRCLAQARSVGRGAAALSIPRRAELRRRFTLRRREECPTYRRAPVTRSSLRWRSLKKKTPWRSATGR